MDTIIEKITGNDELDKPIFEKASEILKAGGLVAFPTETVYGLGADALDAKASAKIYAAKGRPSDNPLIVHIADVNDLYALSDDVNALALEAAKAFWPGPLTMILKKKACVPDSITGGLSTVAIRMPSHKTARRLIQESGIYIAAPSANISGKPSPTRGAHVIHDMDGVIDMIIVDDTVTIGVESTIVDLSEGKPVILRPGYITPAMIKDTLGDVAMDPAIEGTLKANVVPKAPGMKYKHYAPNAQLTIVCGDEARVISYINAQVKELEKVGKRVGVMTTTQEKDRYVCANVKCVGSQDDELSISHNLFAVLREFDEDQTEYIYSESFSEKNVGQAVMNRLIKAAGHTIIHV